MSRVLQHVYTFTYKIHSSFVRVRTQLILIIFNNPAYPTTQRAIIENFRKGKGC